MGIGGGVLTILTLFGFLADKTHLFSNRHSLSNVV